jgi:hypothetical protein
MSCVLCVRVWVWGLGDGGQVKGLFCRLPRDSLEHTVVHGLTGRRHCHTSCLHET